MFLFSKYDFFMKWKLNFVVELRSGGLGEIGVGLVFEHDFKYRSNSTF